MTVINPWPPAAGTNAASDAPGSVNPGSPCPACAATATGVVDMNTECPTGDHAQGAEGHSCVTVEVNHEDGCPKPLNVDDSS